MRKTDKEIEKSIARAIASFPRKDPEKLWDIAVEKSKGTEWYLENTEKSSGRAGLGRHGQVPGLGRRARLLAALVLPELLYDLALQRAFLHAAALFVTRRQTTWNHVAATA